MPNASVNGSALQEATDGQTDIGTQRVRVVSFLASNPYNL